HVVVILVHHIASDGWSMGPLWRDLAAAYEARLGGRAPAFAPLEVGYADYTLWQRALLGDAGDAGSLFSSQVAYWAEALAGLPEVIDLPTDRPRPAVASHRGAGVSVSIPPGLHKGLLSLARSAGASLFMVLEPGLAGLLSRLGAGDDIAIGSPIAGRTDRATEEMVGFFVNTLVLRTDLSGDPSFAEVLARVREVALGAYAHQDVPFEHLVEVLNPARSMAHHPLFQVMLALGNTPGAAGGLAGLRVAGVEADTGVAKFDLSVLLTEARGHDGSPQGVAGVIEYAGDLFDPAGVEALWRRLLALLEAAVADPDRALRRIDILSAAERTRLLVEVNDTAAVLPAAPAHPAGRIASMLADAAPALVLATSATRGSLPAGARILVLDDPDVVAGLEGRPGTDPTDAERCAALSGAHPAYVIYTSGSTGAPKGVVVSHAGLPSLASAQIEHFRIDAHSRVLQLSSPSFDASVMEPLMAYAA